MKRRLQSQIRNREMRSEGNIVYLVVGALVIAMVVLLLMQAKRFDWYETYEIESKEPYGAYVIGEMLKTYYPEKKFTVLEGPMKKALEPNAKDGNRNYVFIGSNMYIDSLHTALLREFVERGNSAFICSGINTTELFDALFPDTCLYYEDDYYHSETDTSVVLNFFNEPFRKEKGFKQTYVFKNQPDKYEWLCFDTSLFCGEKSNINALGYLNGGYYNFIKVHYGDGDFYIHSTPLAFSNYSLIQKENLEYASRVFSFIPAGDILWDEYSKIPGNLNFNSDLKSSQSPLRFILGQDGLRWAWYLSLLFLLLYAIFFSKRRQRIIPLIEPNTNTSLEYINIIGQLYYQSQNHKAICLHKMKLFQIFIRQRYFINISKPDHDIMRNISLKSQVPFEEIKNIFIEYYRINTPASVSSEELITFHQLIENFYKNCK